MLDLFQIHSEKLSTRTAVQLSTRHHGQLLVSSCANESQNQRNCLLSSHVIIQLGHQFGECPFGRSSHVMIQLIFNTAKQRYIYSKQTKKSENKDTVIKFLMSRNIRSLCNTTHNNEQYVPITGYRRHNCTRTKYINSLGHHKLIKLNF